MIISIDGLDCSGKETLANALAAKCEQYFPETHAEVISFPDYTSESGTMIRKILSKANSSPVVEHIPLTRKAFLLSELFVINRKEYFDHHPELDFENSILIFDRYSASNVLYQGQGLDGHQLLNLIHFNKYLDYEVYGNPKPTYSFFLRVPFEILAARLRARKASKSGVEDKYEDPSFLRTSFHLSEQLLAADFVQDELFHSVLNQIYYGNTESDKNQRYIMSPEQTAATMLEILVAKGYLTLPTAMKTKEAETK